MLQEMQREGKGNVANDVQDITDDRWHGRIQ
jgi:hypothetical protein